MFLKQIAVAINRALMLGMVAVVEMDFADEPTRVPEEEI